MKNLKLNEKINNERYVMLTYERDYSIALSNAQSRPVPFIESYLKGRRIEDGDRVATKYTFKKTNTNEWTLIGKSTVSVD